MCAMTHPGAGDFEQEPLLASDAGSAKRRIVQCARELFTRYSFNQISLKDIAEAADVSAPLIVKHFVNKSNLFAQTVDFKNSCANLFAEDFPNLGLGAVNETLTAPHTAPYSMIRVITVTDGEDESMAHIGERIREDLIDYLSERIRREAPYKTPDPHLRAQCAVALLAGLSMMRRFGDPEFAQLEVEPLRAYYARTLQGILDGDPEPPGEEPTAG